MVSAFLLVAYFLREHQQRKMYDSSSSNSFQYTNSVINTLSIKKRKIIISVNNNRYQYWKWLSSIKTSPSYDCSKFFFIIIKSILLIQYHLNAIKSIECIKESLHFSWKCWQTWKSNYPVKSIHRSIQQNIILSMCHFIVNIKVLLREWTVE